MRRKKTLRHIKNVKVVTPHLNTSALLASLFLLAVVIFHQPLEDGLLHSDVKEEERAKNTPLFFDKKSFEGVQLQAKAYVVYDVVGKEVIASNNQEERLPLASITKVMTALTALSLLQDQEDVFAIKSSMVEDGYDLGLKKDQRWHLTELLKYMLIFSSNDAALAIAAHYGGQAFFVKAMNDLSSSYGLTATFTDPAGRDERGEIGGMGTVLDAARLFILAKTTAPDLLDATTKKRQSIYPLSGKLTGIPNTNQSIETLPGAEGSKTGYTDLAGGNLGVVVDISIGRPVVLVVLGSTREGRFDDIDILYKTLQRSMLSVPTVSQ